MQAHCASPSVQHLVVPGPSPTWLFESGLQFLPFSLTRGNLEAVVGINSQRFEVTSPHSHTVTLSRCVLSPQDSWLRSGEACRLKPPSGPGHSAPGGSVCCRVAVVVAAETAGWVKGLLARISVGPEQGQRSRVCVEPRKSSHSPRSERMKRPRR